MRKIGIAVVGCGAMAQMIHLPNVERHPELDFLWCCDIDEGVLRVVGERFHPRRMTADAAEVAADPQVQAVILSTTQTVRLPLIQLFARAGKHIYVEKPLADSFDEMKRILAVVEETGIRFTVGHNRRMAPAVREAVRVLGKHRENPVSPPWRWDREGSDRPHLDGERTTQVLIRVNDDYWSWKKWAFAHGALINEMTHFADLACCFIESAPIRVTVTGGRVPTPSVLSESSGTCIEGLRGPQPSSPECSERSGECIEGRLPATRTPFDTCRHSPAHSGLSDSIPGPEPAGPECSERSGECIEGRQGRHVVETHVIAIEFADGSLASIFATAYGSFGYPKELVEVYHNGAAIIIDHLAELRVAGVVDEPFRTTFPIPNDPYPEIEADGIEGFYRRTEAAQREALAKGDNSIIPPIPDKGHFALLDDFVRSIETGDEPACSARIAAVPTAVILRALESVERGGIPVMINWKNYRE
ncbi:MAG: Gfo/Idh/MocA family oxidoreductase [Armatimonadetes bacterium]|nr:Gfo/Idh/MocA family oxidoreductase [Armatimonadota bacterium]